MKDSASHNMDVQMKNRLAAVSASVDHRSVPARVELVFPRQLRRNQQEMA
jgi:hypothetical protein